MSTHGRAGRVVRWYGFCIVLSVARVTRAGSSRAGSSNVEPRIVYGQSEAALCDARAARRAIELATPLLTAACRDGALGDSGHLHVVVMNPLRTPADCAFEDAILIEASFGDDAREDERYARYARDKARLSWRLGRDGLALQHAFPQHLRAGDTTLGGAIVLDGLVVATSGCLEVYDEALSGCVAMCLRGVVKAGAEAQRGSGAHYQENEGLPPHEG